MNGLRKADLVQHFWRGGGTDGAYFRRLGAHPSRPKLPTVGRSRHIVAALRRATGAELEEHGGEVKNHQPYTEGAAGEHTHTSSPERSISRAP